MVQACSTLGWAEKYVQNFAREILKDVTDVHK